MVKSASHSNTIHALKIHRAVACGDANVQSRPANPLEVNDDPHLSPSLIPAEVLVLAMNRDCFWAGVSLATFPKWPFLRRELSAASGDRAFKFP